MLRPGVFQNTIRLDVEMDYATRRFASKTAVDTCWSLEPGRSLIYEQTTHHREALMEMCLRPKHFLRRSLHYMNAIISLWYIGFLILARRIRPSLLDMCRELKCAHLVRTVTQGNRLLNTDIPVYTYARTCISAQKSEKPYP